MDSNRYLKIINRFALQLLRQSSLEEVLWLIADQAIAELGFEDCVIYLVDSACSHLVQAAAFGPKKSGAKEIVNPIVIPIGQGIVGSVAANGMLERIPNTRLDNRYILDDSFRLSELAVPIMLDGKCIGVIDSEHRSADFFTRDHEEILTTIASMASTKISDAIRARELHATIQKLRATQKSLAKLSLELIRVRYTTAQLANSKCSNALRLCQNMKNTANTLTGTLDKLMTTPLTIAQQEYARLLSDSSYQIGVLASALTELLQETVAQTKIRTSQDCDGPN